MYKIAIYIRSIGARERESVNRTDFTFVHSPTPTHTYTYTHTQREGERNSRYLHASF